MTRVNIGGLYEEFDTIEDVIHYLTFERDERYRAIADALVELLKKHDEDLEKKVDETHSEEIMDYENDIIGYESQIASAREEIQRAYDALDYEDGDAVSISDVRTYLTRIDNELV